jgi:nucleoside-diphosphate-sugar epimerase
MSGDASKFRAATGWRPEIPLERTLRDLLEHERESIRTRRA